MSKKLLELMISTNEEKLGKIYLFLCVLIYFKTFGYIYGGRQIIVL